MSKDSLEVSEAEARGMDKEELNFLKAKKKQRCLSNTKFIGHLYLRKLLTAKIIGSVIQDLARCHDANDLPADHELECICELLNNIGYTLDTQPTGQNAINQVCGRLLDLKTRKNKKTQKSIYPMRIQFMIQNVIDTKNANWVRKVFQAAAKTKDEARKVAGSEVVVAGQRPAWMSAGSGAVAGAPPADDGPWQDVPGKRR